MSQNSKNWWRPVWSGLFIDSSGKHLKQMRNSIWLFLYLLFQCDYKTGIVIKNCQNISQEMGIKKKTIRKWMNNLRKNDYITSYRESHTLVIHIKDWRTFIEYPKRGNQQEVSAPNGAERVPFLGHKGTHDVNNVNNNIYINNDNVNDNIKTFKTSKKEEFCPNSKEELLALDIARGLEDIKNLNYYLSISKTYPEPLLRSIYGEVKEIPEEKIKKSKGALFTYLIQKLCSNQTDQNAS